MPFGDSTQAGADPWPPVWKETEDAMPMLAEQVDAVIGGDTHRGSHALEMTAPNGVPISQLEIGNDQHGFAEAVAWIAEHAPGPRIIVGLEGTRSYGIGLTRVLLAAGLMVVEVERPRRPARRRGKTDPIDAHLHRCTSCKCRPTERPCRAATETARHCGSCSSLAGR
jgi:hypothetical protein